MYIVADVEWVQNQWSQKSPTQLSAARVDENWNTVEEFHACIRPMDSSFHDWNHVAYTGGSPEDFLYAKSCYTVFEAFHRWVGEDTVCWWSHLPTRCIRWSIGSF